MSKVLFEGFDSLRCIAGDAETVEEVADMLESYAVYTRELTKDGVQIDLVDIGSGHLSYSTEDPKIGEKYGFDSIENDGNGHVVVRSPTGEVIDEFDEE